MTLLPLQKHMEAAESLADLARRLGAVCLDHGGQLLALAEDPVINPICEALEQRVAAIDPDRWQALGTPAASTILQSSAVADLISLAAAQHPIEQLSLLRGLCRSALPHMYLASEGQILLDRGTPVPIADRPIHTLFRATPNPSTTLSLGHPLEGLGYKLFEHSAGGAVQVVLDFSHRDRLDEITWAGEQRLPRIATVHPFLGAKGIEIGTEKRTWFFDVRPKEWNEQTMLALLEKVAEVPVAVLPELSLPIADALEHALAADPGRYPALIIAGSAHVQRSAASGRTIRANESRIYLDGQPIATHQKIHPFRTKHLGGHDLSAKLTEGLTREQKTITVLSGEHTRLAVAICADLNDETIPRLLEGAGVNLLLVPAMTRHAGSFQGAICGLASRCQAVAVIVNSGLDPRADQDEEQPPFLVMAAVPRPEPEQQSRSYRDGGERRTRVGIIDPNATLESAMTWMGSLPPGGP